MSRAAGLEGSFSGHSPRVGMCRDLVAHGASLPAIQTAGRWKSPQMVAHYARAEFAGRGAVARFYGVTNPDGTDRKPQTIYGEGE